MRSSVRLKSRLNSPTTSRLSDLIPLARFKSSTRPASILSGWRRDSMVSSFRTEGLNRITWWLGGFAAPERNTEPMWRISSSGKVSVGKKFVAWRLRWGMHRRNLSEWNESGVGSVGWFMYTSVRASLARRGHCWKWSNSVVDMSAPQIQTSRTECSFMRAFSSLFERPRFLFRLESAQPMRTLDTMLFK